MRAAIVAAVFGVRACAELLREYRHSMPMADGEDMGLFLEQTVFTPTASNDQDSRPQANGHLLKVKNPFGRLAVVPPLPGGCGTLQEVWETAKRYKSECTIAVNGGYFDLHEDNLYGCIGNLVSDGKIHHTEPMETTNVNFGILKNGSFFVGYVSPEDVRTGQFLHLIAGLGWLVRDGKNSMEESWKEAYTGACSRPDTYLSMPSGRTSIGYDKDGGLIVLQYDGQSRNPSSGLSLIELADKMLEFGAVEAINIDGGGSTQMWRNGEELGYSSDRAEYGVLLGKHPPGCPIGVGHGNNSAFKCPREVSSILCIQDLNNDLGSALPQVSVLGAGVWYLVGGLTIGLVAGMLVPNMMKRKQTRELASELSEDYSDEDEKIIKSGQQ